MIEQKRTQDTQRLVNYYMRIHNLDAQRVIDVLEDACVDMVSSGFQDKEQVAEAVAVIRTYL